MASLLTLAEIRTNVETDLVDAALQRLIDDAEAEMIRVAGPHSAAGSAEQTAYPERLTADIFLTRQASAVTEVIETLADTDTTLAADDYELLNGGRILRRLSDGTNGRSEWGDRVKVTHTPTTDEDQRKGVLIEVVALAVQYKGLGAEREGDWQGTHLDYTKERARLFKRLVRWSFV